MQKVTNFGEAHAELRKFYGKHADGPYTLDRMREIMAYLGNPQDKLQVIHIAGTSGKTSTAYYIAALLQEAGAKVGLTVSPHIDEVNERVQINLVPLAETEFCHELTEFFGLIEASGIVPSYFECMVAFAYWEFARQQVDYAVVEVGLGGLMDGTNVVTRDDKVCVITDIGLDHTEILGDTLGKIAAQKAGIIHSHNEVFVMQQGDEVMAAIRQQAAAQHASLHTISYQNEGHYPALPAFQQRNFNLAEHVVQLVLDRAGTTLLTSEKLHRAAHTYIPGRMESIEYQGKMIIVDGAHNAQKLQTLFDSLRERHPDVSVAAVVGFVEGDSTRLHGSLDVLMANTTYLIVTSFYTEKDYPKHSVDTATIVRYCHDKDWQKIEVSKDPAAALQVLLGRPEPILVITGSFYLLNHIRPLVVH